MNRSLFLLSGLALAAGTLVRGYGLIPFWLPPAGSYLLLNLCALVQQKRFVLWLFPVLFLLIGMFPERPANPGLDVDEIVHLVSGIRGRVVNSPRRDRRGRWFFDMMTESFEVRTESGVRRRPGRERIRVTGLLSPELLCRGQVLSLRGELREAVRAVLPGGFDERDYLRAFGIFRVFEVRPGSGPRFFSDPSCPLQEVRDRIDRRFSDLFGAEYAALAQALITGNRSAMTPALRLRFARTGTAHLLAISGLHLALFAAGLYTLLLALGLRPRLICLICGFCVLFYAALSGLRVPVLRAAIMTVAALFARATYRRYSVREAFGLSLLILIGIDPRLAGQASFLLSFISVGILIFLIPAWVDRWSWYEGILITVVITAAILPLAAGFFSILSPVSPLANMLAVPLMTGILFPLLLLIPFGTLPWIGPMLVSWTSLCLDGLNGWLDWLMGLPGAFIHVSAPGRGETALYYFLLIALLGILRLPWLRRNQIRFTVLILWTFLWTGCWAASGEERHWEMTVFPAGRHAAVHLRFPGGHDWIVSDPAESRKVQDYLEHEAVNHLSGWIFPVNKKFFPSDFRPVGGEWHYCIRPHASLTEAGERGYLLKNPVTVLHPGGGTINLYSFEKKFITVVRMRDLRLVFLDRPLKHDVDIHSMLPATSGEGDGPVILVLGDAVRSSTRRIETMVSALKPSIVILTKPPRQPLNFSFPVIYLCDGAVRLERELHGVSLSRYNGKSYDFLPDQVLRQAFV